MTFHCDVAIVGGGPGGSTAGSLLKKYAPDLNVMIFERETFPRDHVGESLLPRINAILAELEVWDDIEAANFPIKIGATYRWGSTDTPWVFDFLPHQFFADAPRPAKYEGQRRETAFQVERAKYDQILLNNARRWGCKVFEGFGVRDVFLDPADHDRIMSLGLVDGSDVRATHYIDATGNAATLRRALGVQVDEPTRLQNIAIWDYWQNADWADHIGVGGTRIQIMSLGYGWIWFIPLGPTRTSIGLVIPAKYYKESGERPETLYVRALGEEPSVRRLTAKATRENRLATTKDWSFVSERWVGDNWFLVGEAGGFADPILSAGLTLTHTSAREAAYVILDLEKRNHDAAFLKSNYQSEQIKRVRQHMMFADYWYSANGQFTDLVAYCSDIAERSGLKLDPNEAFQWLGTGGFANESLGEAGLGGFSIVAIKSLLQRLSDQSAKWEIGTCNVFKFNIEGAQKSKYVAYYEGDIILEDALVRNGLELPFTGLFGLVLQAVKESSSVIGIDRSFRRYFAEHPWLDDENEAVRMCFHTLEALVAMGWITASYDPGLPLLPIYTPINSLCLHDAEPACPATSGV